MVFNATFNNISVISWQSVFIGGGKTEYPEKTTDLSQVTEDERLEDYNTYIHVVINNLFTSIAGCTSKYNPADGSTPHCFMNCII